VKIGIGSPSDRGQGYGSEALRLLLRYAFAELNLFRLSAFAPEYNPVALHIFRKAGFVQEVCRRQALNRDGRRWDLVYLGLLREEWEKMREA
jgi:RimJ/RimL family protein N-acetyltransferase